LMTFKKFQTNNISVTMEDPLEVMKAHKWLKIQSTWNMDIFSWTSTNHSFFSSILWANVEGNQSYQLWIANSIVRVKHLACLWHIFNK
jgi:hypothetical protein